MRFFLQFSLWFGVLCALFLLRFWAKCKTVLSWRCMFTLAFSNLKFESQKLFLIWQKDVNCCWVKNKGKYGQYNFLIRIQFYNQTCWTSLWFIPINCKIYLDILGKFTNEHIYHILLSSKIKLHWNCTSFNRLCKNAVFRFL